MYIVAKGGEKALFWNLTKSCAIVIPMFSCTQKGCLHLGLVLENVRAPEDSSRLQIGALECPGLKHTGCHSDVTQDCSCNLADLSTGQEYGRSYASFLAKELSIWRTPGVQRLEGLYPRLWGLLYSWLKCLTKAWNVNFYCWKYNLRYLCSSLWEGLLLIQGIKKTYDMPSPANITS